MSDPTARIRSILPFLVAGLCFVFAFSTVSPARAEDHPKKKSEEHSKRPTKKKTTKKKKGEGFEDVQEGKAVGSDHRVSGKNFDDEAAQAGKVDAVLVIDASRSMQRTDPKRLRDQAAKLFLRFLGEGDRVAVVQFDREAKVVVPLTEVNPGSLPGLDKSIETIPVEGAFTDLEVPLEEAMKLLIQDGRKEATKTVVLLSDGKMDPHPSRGTPEELTQKVKEIILPEFKDKAVKLYTVAFSEESDKSLLAEFATDAGGLSWYAPDAGTIHKRFSELFLTLKRPQVVPLDGEGFEVDSSVQEATFYISRKIQEEAGVLGGVTLVDPRGIEISSTNIPPGIKWFSSELFDIVTVTRPFPGRWTVKGIESAEGFATLLSDIKLQVRWPQSSFKLGDSVVVYARLTNEGEEVAKPGLEEITFYTYKIVNADTGASWLTGALNDKGESGDTKAGDGIFSTTLKLDREGEYQALFAVTSPTFTRQQRISFTTSAGLISLKIIPADDFAGTPETILAVMSKNPAEYKALKVQLVAKKEGEEKALGLTLKPRKDSPEMFDVPIEKLGAGNYELSVRFQGTDEKKKAVTGASEPIKYTVHPHEGEAASGEGTIEEIAEEEAHAEEEAAEEGGHGDLIAGLVGILGALAWVGIVAFIGLKKVSGSKSQVDTRKPYVVPPELAAQIETIRGAASESRRRATAQDKEAFSIVADVFAGKTADDGGGEGGEGGDDQPASEEEQASS